MPDGDRATVVTEVFDPGVETNQWILDQEGGRWINGSTTVRESMAATLDKLAALCGDEQP